MTLSLGFSPCPNDCFMFDAIVHRPHRSRRAGVPRRFGRCRDAQPSCLRGDIDVTKLSFHAFAHCADAFVLLDAGSALGRGCGPLLISKRNLRDTRCPPAICESPSQASTRLPTSCCGLAFPAAARSYGVVFSEIEAAVLAGRFDAGVIIHENRFTYEAKGLRKMIDLGEFWEATTGAPIPLGGIAVKRSLPRRGSTAMNRVMRRSVEYAFAHPEGEPRFRPRARTGDERGRDAAAHRALRQRLLD